MKNMKQLLIATLMIVAISGTLGIVGCGGEPDPRTEDINNDMLLMKRNIDESDTTTFAIKSILDIAEMDGFDVENFEYYTEIKEDKALILVRIPEIKDVVKEDRGIFLDLIDGATEGGEWAGKEKYIGVFGKLRLRLSMTPDGRKEKLTTRMDLLDYYGPKPAPTAE